MGYKKYISLHNEYLSLKDYGKITIDNKIKFFKYINNFYNLYIDPNNIPKDKTSREFKYYRSWKHDLLILLQKAYLEIILNMNNKELQYNSASGNCLYDSTAKLINKLILSNEDYFQLLKQSFYIYFNNKLVDEILNTPLDEGKVRLLVGNFYELNKEEYSLFIVNGEDPKILKNKNWGGELELNIISKLFNVKINVYNSEGFRDSHNYNENGSIYNIDVAYISPNHYNCTRNLDEEINTENSENVPLNLDYLYVIEKVYMKVLNNLDIPIDLNTDYDIDFLNYTLPRPDINPNIIKTKKKKKGAYKNKNNSKKNQTIKNNRKYNTKSFVYNTKSFINNIKRDKIPKGLNRDLLNLIKVDIRLRNYDFTLCETSEVVNSLYFSFMKLINNYFDNNIEYKEIIINKILDYKFDVYNGEFDIEVIKLLCFNNMIYNSDNLIRNLIEELGEEKMGNLNLKKYGKKMMKKETNGGLLSTVSLCDFFMTNLVIINKSKITLFEYNKGNIKIKEIDNIGNNIMVMYLEEKYYPLRHIRDNSKILKTLINYNEIISSFK